MSGEGDLVSGSGWISDDSSFYGDEETQGRMQDEELGDRFMPAEYWANHQRSLNKIALEFCNKVPELPAILDTPTPGMSAATRPDENVGDRNAVFKETPVNPFTIPIVLHNRMEGQPSAWQLGESVDDFIARLPPVTTSIDDCGPWIWVMNPYPERRRGSEKISEFKVEGSDLLDRFCEKRKQVEAENAGKTQGTITKKLNVERERLKDQIRDLAVQKGILSGKWMFFPTLGELSSLWRELTEAVIENRLGIGAKVATDDGTIKSERLICIYTQDFTDTEDVRRVLDELVRMGLVDANMPRGIFYKNDAYTHLDITGKNEYGLKASLYSSKTILSEKRVSGQRLSEGKPILTPFARMRGFLPRN